MFSVRQSAEVHFASDHPTGAGHFPGNPIIPGALLLDEVLKLITEPACSSGEILIRATKFFCPVKPGETILVKWESQAGCEIKFECYLIDRGILAASGIIDVRQIER